MKHWHRYLNNFQQYFAAIVRDGFRERGALGHLSF